MPSELPAILNPYDPRSPASAVRDTAKLLGIDRLRVSITTARVGAGQWLYTVQVIDRRGQPVRTTADVRLFVSETKGGPPGGAQTETFLTGTVLFTDTPGVEWEARTTPMGTISLTLAFTAGPRYLNGGRVTEYESSLETTP